MNSYLLTKKIDVGDAMILHISTPNIQNPFLCYVKGASGKYIYIGQANTLTEAKEIINETL